MCPPGMTESLMQKDPTWRKVGDWERGRGHEGTLGFLFSPFVPPTQKTHLSSFLCHTPFSIRCSPSHSSSRLFTSQSLKCFCFFYISQAARKCDACHISCHLPYFVLTFFGHKFFACGPSRMQMSASSTDMTIVVRGKAISWPHALKQFNYAPPPIITIICGCVG